MKRYTILINEEYSIENANLKQAINKLAVFENICDEILEQQEEISEKLAILRDEGKEKSVKFKELMIKKLTNLNLINLLKTSKIL